MTSVHLPNEIAKELMAYTGQPDANTAILKLANDFLKEQRRKQREILKYAGTFEADPAYDYKEQRHII